MHKKPEIPPPPPPVWSFHSKVIRIDHFPEKSILKKRLLLHAYTFFLTSFKCSNFMTVHCATSYIGSALILILTGDNNDSVTQDERKTK